jgi:hypothetical protein
MEESEAMDSAPAPASDSRLRRTRHSKNWMDVMHTLSSII